MVALYNENMMIGEREGRGKGGSINREGQLSLVLLVLSPTAISAQTPAAAPPPFSPTAIMTDLANLSSLEVLEDIRRAPASSTTLLPVLIVPSATTVHQHYVQTARTTQSLPVAITTASIAGIMPGITMLNYCC